MRIRHISIVVILLLLGPQRSYANDTLRDFLGRPVSGGGQKCCNLLVHLVDVSHEYGVKKISIDGVETTQITVHGIFQNISKHSLNNPGVTLFIYDKNGRVIGLANKWIKSVIYPDEMVEFNITKVMSTLEQPVSQNIEYRVNMDPLTDN